jgi:signal peptidase II
MVSPSPRGESSDESAAEVADSAGAAAGRPADDLADAFGSGEGGTSDQSAPAEADGWRARLGRRDRRQDLLFLGLAGAWVALDQVTKVILRESLSRGEHWEVASFFRISHITNDGAAFGLFGGSGIWLAILPLIAIVAIAVYYLFPPVDHWATRLGLALILGGAIGNWLDRLYQGEVTDFVNFNEFPAFNVADIGINLGIAAILIYLVVTDARRSPPHR